MAEKLFDDGKFQNGVCDDAVNVCMHFTKCTCQHTLHLGVNTFNCSSMCMLYSICLSSSACKSAFKYPLNMLMFVCVVSGSRLLQPAQVCDVLKGLILVLCFSMMHYVDYSMMYHLIRGQSVIKLYIIYNMLEVAQTLYTLPR